MRTAPASKPARDTLALRFAGVGGQGVQFLADVVSKAAFRAGLSPHASGRYGAEVRGGVTVAEVVMSPTFCAWPYATHPTHSFLLHPKAAEDAVRGDPETLVLLTDAPVPEGKRVVKVPREALTADALAASALGFLAAEGLLDAGVVRELLSKGPAKRQGRNLRAFDRATRAC